MIQVIRTACSFFALLLWSGCVVENTFKAPVVFEESTGTKRLTVFRANSLPDSEPGNIWPPDCYIFAVPSNGKRIANLQIPLNGYPAFTFEMNSEDTGSITFIMAPEMRLFSKRHFYADTTIHFKYLALGNNYYQLNYDFQFGNNSVRVPVLQLNKIEINVSTFPSLFPAKTKQALRYNLSTNSILYERKKGILSRHARNNRINELIRKNYTSVNSTTSEK